MGYYSKVINAKPPRAKKREDILIAIFVLLFSSHLAACGAYYNSYYRSQEQRAGYWLVRRLLEVNITDSNKY